MLRLSPRVIYSFVSLLGIMYSVSGRILGVKIQQNGGRAVGIPVWVKCLIGSKQTRKRSQTLHLAEVSTKMVWYSKRKEARHRLGKDTEQRKHQEQRLQSRKMFIVKEQRASQCGLRRMGEKSSE